LDELNYEEIVEITQMSLANVKVSLHRAKKKMKLLFDQKEIAINT
jgi:DNA-directed RNA polymerase specialized sigma24 family protein